MRAAEEVKAEQEELAKHYNLDWWYHTKGRKCCGVYPKFRTIGLIANQKSYLICEVCGRKTEAYEMAWQARNEWDSLDPDTPEGQMSLFSIF